MNVEFGDGPNAALRLAPFLVEVGRYLAADPDTLRAMGVDPDKPLAPDILPRAALIAFLELARDVAPPPVVLEWLQLVADHLHSLSTGPQQNV